MATTTPYGDPPSALLGRLQSSCGLSKTPHPPSGKKGGSAPSWCGLLLGPLWGLGALNDLPWLLQLCPALRCLASWWCAGLLFLVDMNPSRHCSVLQHCCLGQHRPAPAVSKTKHTFRRLRLCLVHMTWTRRYRFYYYRSSAQVLCGGSRSSNEAMRKKRVQESRASLRGSATIQHLREADSAHTAAQAQ
jgi:hypothetical protein